jgi:hypothetical protein
LDFSTERLLPPPSSPTNSAIEPKNDPGLLARELPHRSAETLIKIAQNLTILLWSDFAEMVCLPGSDAETNAVKEELKRRILG